MALVAVVAAQCPSGATPATAPAATQAPAVTQPSGDQQQITVAGSTTVQPLAEKLAQAFAGQNPQVKINVSGGGSSVGVKSAGQGTVDVGMASREVKDSEKTEYPNIKIYVIARDGIAIVTHPDVAVQGLTTDQVRDIFAGTITNLQDVGGPDKAIIVVSREEGSGTRGAFEELVMGQDAVITEKAILQPSNGAVRTTVSTTPDSVGFLSFGYLDSSVKALPIDGVEATEANAASGTYPVVRPLNMLTLGEPAGAVKAWLDFILGPAGQNMVGEEGYIKVK
ncbi:MAG: phosphate ABC transporter substrate-binding protein [Chloroflexi bacterium]|nr:phosphate ABC transporter substrate-binding protein [Chloroflexota bacterium]